MADPSASRATDRRRALGRQGEAAAAAHLATLGYRLRARNYRCPLGEVDLVAEEGADVVFVEVKTRSGFTFGLPHEAVSRAKQRKLGRVALWYCQEQGLEERGLRFDVVEVIVLGGQVAGVELYRHAFVPPEG
jgi:putative endonuclease